MSSICSVDNLVGLFRGDEDSMGYAHTELVCEICTRTKNGTTITPEWMKELIYPGVKREDIDEELFAIIVDGVKLWTRRKRPRRSL